MPQLPNKGQVNWGDSLSNFLRTIQDENGGIYSFADETARDAYFDSSTPFKTAVQGKTCVITGSKKIQKHNGSAWADILTGQDLSGYQLLSEKGAVNGYVPLNASTKIDSTYLPSYVDDVEEYADLAGFPVSGETGKIYVALDSNLTYRWSGSAYVELTDTSAVWGNISGSIANQTDLQSALGGKEPTLTKGNLSEATSSVLTISGGTGAVIGSGASIEVKQASGSQSGYLSSTDWTTFNNKQNALSFDSTPTNGSSNPVTSDGIYDFVEELRPASFYAGTMNVVYGTLNAGTVADLQAVGGTDVSIQETNTANALQVQFSFTGVTRLTAFAFFGEYNGGPSHQIQVEIYNYDTTGWDSLGVFGTSASKQWYSFEIFDVPSHISSGAVEVRLRHIQTGTSAHSLTIDYLELNYGGGGGYTNITASSITFVPVGNISATNVQAAINELDSEKFPSSLIDSGTTSGQAIYWNGSKWTYTGYTIPSTDGTSGQVLKTNGTGALTWQDDSSTTTFLGLTDTPSSYTAGSILFTSSSAVTEDNSNLFWDDTNNRLGIGQAVPTARVHSKGTTSDDTAYSLKVDDSSNANLLSVRNDGLISFKNYALPTADGTSGQVLKTNGSGVLTWSSDTGAQYINDLLDAKTTTTSVFLGSDSGNNETGTGYNTSVGVYSLYTNTSGYQNSAFGYQTLYANTTGFQNSAFGEESMVSNTTGKENSAFGVYSLMNNTTGSYNSAFGNYSLVDNTIGEYNAAFGQESLRHNTEGISNSAFGDSALRENTTGNYNVAVGEGALRNNETGSDNVAVGKEALVQNTASENTAVGTSSLFSNVTGQANVAVGFEALKNSTTDSNTAVGHSALSTNVDGIYNTAVGAGSLFSNTSGFENTAAGVNSLAYNSEGGNNAAFGNQALRDNTAGDNNAAFGHESLSANTTGFNNSAIGQNAGRYITGSSVGNQTSNTSVYLGANTKASADGNSNEIVIGYDATGNGSNTVTIGNSSITNVKTAGSLTLGAITIPNTDGTNGQVLKTDGSGTLSWQNDAAGSTAGSDTQIQFNDAGAFGANSIFVWDKTNSRLGVGQSTPTARVHSKGTTSDDTAYSLKVDDSSDANLLSVRNDGLISFKNYALPTADGTSGQVLKTNGSGVLTWQNETVDSIFEESSNVIREISTAYDNDFVIGSPQLADDGNSAHDNRMFFDKSKGAFRAGAVTATDWDDANVGSYSFAGGWNSKASGGNSAVFGAGCEATATSSFAAGWDTTASNSGAVAFGGTTTASGIYSFASGGNTVASGEHSFASGYYGTASGNYSFANGYYPSAYLYGMSAQASGRFSVNGDAQFSNLVAWEVTGGATPEELFLDGTGLSQRMVLPANRTWKFKIDVAARQTGGSAGTVGDSAAYEFSGLIKRDGANNTVIVGSVIKNTVAEDQTAWDVNVSADDTNESLKIEVTGEANKTIRWVAKVELVEVG